MKTGVDSSNRTPTDTATLSLSGAEEFQRRGVVPGEGGPKNVPMVGRQGRSSGSDLMEVDLAAAVSVSGCAESRGGDGLENGDGAAGAGAGAAALAAQMAWIERQGCNAGMADAEVGSSCFISGLAHGHVDCWRGFGGGVVFGGGAAAGGVVEGRAEHTD